METVLPRASLNSAGTLCMMGMESAPRRWSRPIMKVESLRLPQLPLITSEVLARRGSPDSVVGWDLTLTLYPFGAHVPRERGLVAPRISSLVVYCDFANPEILLVKSFRSVP